MSHNNLFFDDSLQKNKLYQSFIALNWKFPKIY